jgi:hypothetical protein
MFWLNIRCVAGPYYMMRLYRTSRPLYQIQFHDGSAITVTDTGRIVATIIGDQRKQ